MRLVVGAIIFLMSAAGCAQFGIHDPVSNTIQNKGIYQKPEFYTMQWKQGTQFTEKPTAISIEVDSIGQQEVRLLVNGKDEPILYASDISTPVCADGECRLMHIRLYWSLLGEYAGFDRYPKLPLTKHEHDEFLSVDYIKLHQLLMDDNSILKRKKIHELVDKPKQSKIEGVDAVAGATIKEVKESVVAGALYSCYTAWHLVHGPVRDEIKKHTLTLLNDTMVSEMILSNNSDYQLFVLK
ncbi:MAG: hypothetical protein HKN31_00135, partial [Pricia sp.]|nr:hypothetical protein [Pricia sp.]